jgi:N-acetylglucosamine-6-sulfatase
MPEQFRMRLARGGAVLWGLLAFTGGLFPDSAYGEARPPNVVLIVTDDQRWDTLRYMPIVSSELARKGVRFRNAFAVNPLCCPSRAAILTGTYSHTNGVWSNSGRHGGLAAFDETPTIATWLDSVGYRTMLIGKYMNGYHPASVRPYVPVGWDRWLAFFPGGYFSYLLTDGVSVFRGREYSTDVLAARAEDFVRSAVPPFFLYFAPYAPHQWGSFNVSPAPRHVDAFAGAPYTKPPSVNEADISDKPSFTRRRSIYATKDLTRLREEQLESLLAVDEAVGRVITALKETGRLANTLFVFTSDNGLTWGEHRWAGRKRVPYEESIRVPLIIRWDALRVPPRTEERFVLNVDIASTITRTAGVTVRRRDGRSLVPLLSGGPVSWRSRFLIESFSPSANLPPYCGVRGQRWKYVQYRNGEEELYDLARDPYELRNRAAGPRYRAKVMNGRMRVRRSACRPPGFRPLHPCTRVGTNRGETIRGTRWRDWICARGGDDIVRVRGNGRDVVRCGPGRDRVHAGAHDRTYGCERVIRL